MPSHSICSLARASFFSHPYLRLSSLAIVSLLSAVIVTVYSTSTKADNLHSYEINQEFIDTWAWNWDREWSSGHFNNMTLSYDSIRGNVVKVKYTKGQLAASGAQVYTRMYNTNAGNREDLYMTYWLKFDKNFDFKLGGKLPGFASNDTGYNNGIPVSNGFSTRSMWRKDGLYQLYLYTEDQPNYASGTYGHQLNSQFYFVPDTWYKMTHRVKLNDAGVSNGIFSTWINGKRELHVDNIRYRNYGQNYSIQTMWLSTFFGGGSDEFRPTKDEYAYFSSFTVSDHNPQRAQAPAAPESSSGSLDGLAGNVRLKDNWKGYYAHADGPYGGLSAKTYEQDWYSQRFVLEQVSGDIYRIRNSWTEQYVGSPSTDTGVALTQTDLNTEWWSLQWQAEDGGNGSVRFRNRWTGQYLRGTGELDGQFTQNELNTSWGSMRFTLEAW